MSTLQLTYWIIISGLPCFSWFSTPLLMLLLPVLAFNGPVEGPAVVNQKLFPFIFKFSRSSLWKRLFLGSARVHLARLVLRRNCQLAHRVYSLFIAVAQSLFYLFCTLCSFLSFFSFFSFFFVSFFLSYFLFNIYPTFLAVLFLSLNISILLL